MPPPAEVGLGALTRLAAELAEAPIGMICLLDDTAAPLRPTVGNGGSSLSRDTRFRDWTLRTADRLTIVPDLTQHAGFFDHPAVTGTDGVRFYAGAPIVSLQGRKLGSLGLFDRRTRELPERLARQITDLAGYAAMHLDHERVSAELQQSQENWAARNTVGPVMLWSATAEGVPLEQNLVWMARFGLTAETAAGRGWFTIIHPDDLDRTEHAWVNGLSRLEPIDIEHRLRQAGGEYLWFRTWAQPVRITSIGAIRWYGMTEDIHDRITTHAALRESEERLSLALGAGNFGIWELDPSSERLIATDQCARNIGLRDSSELTNFDMVRAVTHPEDRDKHQTAVEQVITAGTDLQLEYRVIWPDQSVHWLRVVGRAVANGTAPLRLIGLSLDITEQRHAEEERLRAEARAIYLANHDPLTGLANRRRFGELLTEALLSALTSAARGTIAVLLLDLDYFKAINDTWGHQVGDTILQLAADRLRGSIRQSDTASRYSGDGFAVLQTGVAAADDAIMLAHRIRTAFKQAFQVEGEQIMLDVSIGVALAPDEPVAPSQLLRNADTALYRAKTAERGNTELYQAAMHTGLQARQALRLGLRTALQRDEFRLVYEPLIDLATGRIVVFEALLRWHHPVLGVVSPTEFIPIAEETGLIVEIGASVLRQACRDAATWPAAIGVAVNLSPVQFGAGTLEADVQTALSEAKLDPGRLELEITEGALLQDTNANLSLLRALRRSGVHLSLDDFGTGYSSLAYLRRFPVDKIKIDRSLISGLPDSENGDQIVKAIIGLGRSLGIRTVCEGVETMPQFELVRALGCDQAQGHLFSRPLPAAEIAPLLERSWTN